MPEAKEIFEILQTDAGREYLHGSADREEVRKCVTGDKIWVVARDDHGFATDVIERYFIAETRGYVITADDAYLCCDGFRDRMNDILAHACEATMFGWDTDVFEVFPLADCFLTEAEAANAPCERVIKC